MNQCRNCGKEFESENKDNDFCSDQCFVKYCSEDVEDPNESYEVTDHGDSVWPK